MDIVTRFAPSPTGILHLGGCRTALFNWLFARANGGQYRLRIEDTDRKRSTKAAEQAILEGLEWLGLNHDGDIIRQHNNLARHRQIAWQLVEQNLAYRCYASEEELRELRETLRQKHLPIRYDRRWRDRDPSHAPEGIAPAIRIKMPLEGSTTIHDLVQGPIRFDHKELDDFVLLRADGTPTYMLSVVVDDHDMGITHIIRGDDHLTNMVRQEKLYQACGFAVPEFAHIPLIHASDGAKLSKRHGAVGIEHWRDQGYLPDAMFNYLLRLGWGHGDMEIIRRDQAVKLFDLKGIGRSPARFDEAKLLHLGGYYLRQANNTDLIKAIIAEIRTQKETVSQDSVDLFQIDLFQIDLFQTRLEAGMDGLKKRARTLNELAEASQIYCKRPSIPFAEEKARNLVLGENRAILQALTQLLAGVDIWKADAIETLMRDWCSENSFKLGQAAQPLRAAISGNTSSPGLFEVMHILGQEEVLARLERAIHHDDATP